MTRLSTASVFVLSLCLGCMTASEQGDELRLDRYEEIGGNFVLTDHNGNRFELSDYRGKTILLFFGFTHCPDICPSTLSTIARVHDLLGKQNKQLLTTFISVDPERDRPDVLKEYLDYFDMPALGLTGEVEEIDAVVSQYKASYEKVETDSAAGYLVNHSVYTYLIDRKGIVRALIHQQHTPEAIAKSVRALLDEGSQG